VKEDNVTRGVFAKHFLGDVPLGQVLLDLSQREFFQLGYVVLGTMSVQVGSGHTGICHLVGRSVDRFG